MIEYNFSYNKVIKSWFCRINFLFEFSEVQFNLLNKFSKFPIKVKKKVNWKIVEIKFKILNLEIYLFAIKLVICFCQYDSFCKNIRNFPQSKNSY
jgi:hypothetical protein